MSHKVHCVSGGLIVSNKTMVPTKYGEYLVYTKWCTDSFSLEKFPFPWKIFTPALILRRFSSIHTKPKFVPFSQSSRLFHSGLLYCPHCRHLVLRRSSCSWSHRLPASVAISSAYLGLGISQTKANYIKLLR